MVPVVICETAWKSSKGMYYIVNVIGADVLAQKEPRYQQLCY